MINFGIIGIGNIAHRVAKGILCSKKANLYAVASRNKDNAEQFQKQYGAEKAYGSYKELLEDAAVDAVYICTPNSLHYEQIQLCLSCGKHVVCEKPMVANSEQVKELFAQARKVGCFLMEAEKTDYCSCPNKKCPIHGNCFYCVQIHRGHGGHLPYCMFEMVNERLAGLASLTEGTLKSYMSSLQNVYLKKLLHAFFVEDEEFVKVFKYSSAAKAVHHGFVGGLLEHTLSVVKMCDYFAANYPVLNRDLLLTAAIFHDIGKTEELSAFPENDYTDDGQLLGHIVIGAEMVGERIRKIPGFPAKTANELKHCILAHHGELEYGSPKKPALIEAAALNFADNTDAKLETMREMLENNNSDSEWLGYNRLLESNFKRTSPL